MCAFRVLAPRQLSSAKVVNKSKFQNVLTILRVPNPKCDVRSNYREKATIVHDALFQISTHMMLSWNSCCPTMTVGILNGAYILVECVFIRLDCARTVTIGQDCECKTMANEVIDIL